MCNSVRKMTEKPANLYAFIEDYIRQIHESAEHFAPVWQDRIPLDWYTKIQPASEKNIAALKKVSGFAQRGLELPAEYLAFLRRMGQNDGGLLSNYFDCYSDIVHLIRYYEENDEYFDEEPDWQDNQLLITIGELTDEPDFCLTVKEDGSHEISGRSYTWSHKQPTDYYAETFDKFFMQIIFHLYEQAKYQNTIFFTSCYNDVKDNVLQYGDTTIMRQVDELAAQYGFQKSWCSDQWHYCGFKEKSCLMIHRDFTYSGLIGTDDVTDIGNLEEEINSLLHTHTQESF